MRLQRLRFPTLFLLVLVLMRLYVPGTASPGTPQPQTALSSTGWDSVPAILARIKAPKFPARDFIITDYGAIPGISSDSTEAIRKAINACNTAGGGRVVIPRGVFKTGA